MNELGVGILIGIGIVIFCLIIVSIFVFDFLNRDEQRVKKQKLKRKEDIKKEMGFIECDYRNV